MPRPAPGPTRSPIRLALAATAALATSPLLAACDTGDGRELRPPTAPPPTATAPDADGAEDLPDDDAGLDPALLPGFAEFELFAAWRDGAPIAERHTCDGDEIAPALSWTGVPDDTVELAITVVDEQADGLVHWVVTGIDPSAVSILEGTLLPGATERTNSFEVAGWTGPCPPEGAQHTYRFALHALDQQLEVLDDESASATAALVEALALQTTSITATYSR